MFKIISSIFHVKLSETRILGLFPVAVMSHIISDTEREVSNMIFDDLYTQMTKVNIVRWPLDT